MQKINLIYSVVQWCNENVGFATIVLSALTLMVSIVAIVVSIKTAQLPYKKLLKIETGSCFTIDGEKKGLYVTAINCGNMDFTIQSMGFISNEKKFIINVNSNNQYPARLHNGEMITEVFTIRAFEIQELLFYYKIIAYVKDSEGRVYKKKMMCK